MSNLKYEYFVDEVSDILPALTKRQAEELNELIADQDYEAARFYLNYLAKLYR